ASGPDPARGARSPWRHDRNRARRRIPRGGGARLVPLREAVGARTVPADRPRESPGRNRRPVSTGLRLVRRAATPRARRISASGADAAGAVRHVESLLVAGEAADGP